MKLRHAVCMKTGQLLMRTGWNIIKAFGPGTEVFDYHEAASKDARLICFGTGFQHPTIPHSQLMSEQLVTERERTLSKVHFLSYLHVPIFMAEENAHVRNNTRTI